MPSISGMPASVSRVDSSDKAQRRCCRLSVDGVSRRFFDASVAKWGVTKMSYVYAFGGDLCALGGWTVTIDGSRKFGGYLAIVYTFVGGTWKIRSSVFKYPTS